MRIWIYRCIMAGFVVLLMAGSARANPFRGMDARWKWWERTEVRRAIGLTEDQVSRIREIVRTNRGIMIDLKGAMEKKGLALEDEVERADYDLQRANAAADEFHKARGEIERARLGLLLEIRGVLTQDQFFKLREMREQRRRSRPSPHGREAPPPPNGPSD